MTISAESNHNVTLDLQASVTPAKLIPVSRSWIRIEIAWLHRFWWYVKAYGTVFGIFVLTIGSLVILSLHQRSRQFWER